ncbi:hypothetical protein LHA01_11390 [Schleiferilactobacillus harbinensis]|nr:hypothetical protein LHA01_11390 [Schleiferilactobacillus harbinensis]
MMVFEGDSAKVVDRVGEDCTRRFHKCLPHSSILAMTRYYVLTEAAAKEYAVQLTSIDKPLPYDSPGRLY